MLRFRFTVRRIMGVVAVMGTIGAAGLVWCRQASLREIARYHALEVDHYDYILDGGVIVKKDSRGRVTRTSLGTFELDQAGSPAMREFIVIGLGSRTVQARAAYHATLKDKYERAARQTWLPVPPDPPEPK